MCIDEWILICLPIHQWVADGRMFQSLVPSRGT